MILASLVTLALLGIVAQGQLGRRSLAARVALRFDGGRSWRTTGWAAGTAVTYALPGLVALVVLGPIDGIVRLPTEFLVAARTWSMPASLGPDALEIVGGLALGAAIGTALLIVARLLGRAPSRRLYRSPAAARGWREAPAAVLLALSAGVSEELFFRLALPLATAMATGSALAGLVVGTAAFGLAHRYQGMLGLVLTTLVGAGLVWLYLWTGALWFVVLVHATVDVHALVVRPWIAGWSGSDRLAGR